MNNCKLYRHPTPKRWEDEKIPIDSLDIPIISYDNSMLIVERDEDDSYIKTFKLSRIECGLCLYNGQYYQFSHNIVDTPKTFSIRGTDELNFSYDIYPIKQELADKIITNRVYEHWEIVFHAYYYYNEVFLSCGSVYGRKNYKYISKLEGDSMFLPSGRMPTDLKDGQTYSDFMSSYRIKYPLYKHSVTLNKYGVRDILIGLIL